MLPSLSAVVRIVLLASALTAVAAPAFPDEPKSRQEALAQLAGADSSVRMEAIVWFANHGTMADAGLLEQRLRDEDEGVRAYAERGMWAIWSRSGDPEIDRLMARGVEEMEQGNHKAAIATFSEVVKKKPGFAEGWNRRATVYYMAGEYRKSIADCDEVLKRNPKHFGALSGLGQIYTRLEQYAEALRWFRRALEVNPNMIGVEINIKQVEELLKKKRFST